MTNLIIIMMTIIINVYMAVKWLWIHRNQNAVLTGPCVWVGPWWTRTLLATVGIMLTHIEEKFYQCTIIMSKIVPLKRATTDALLLKEAVLINCACSRLLVNSTNDQFQRSGHLLLSTTPCFPSRLLVSIINFLQTCQNMHRHFKLKREYFLLNHLWHTSHSCTHRCLCLSTGMSWK